MIIIKLVYIAQSDTNGILTALYRNLYLSRGALKTESLSFLSRVIQDSRKVRVLQITHVCKLLVSGILIAYTRGYLQYSLVWKLLLNRADN